MKAIKLILLLLVFCTADAFAQDPSSIVKIPEGVAPQDPVTKMHNYTIGFLRVPGYNRAFAGIDKNITGKDWPTYDISDVDGDGYLDFNFSCYNGEVRVYYWDKMESDKKKNQKGNPYQQKSEYVDPEGYLIFLVVDGKIYKKGTMLLPPPPGKGDNMIRYIERGDFVDVYTNYAELNRAFVSAFIMLEADEKDANGQWKEREQFVQDASGWAKTTVSKYDLLTNTENTSLDIRLGYGAITAEGTRIFPDPKKSRYKNGKGDGITIPGTEFKN